MQVTGSAQGHDTLCDGRYVSLFVQVDGLEDIYVWHAVSSAGGLKVVNVFHELELATRSVDLGHRTWQELRDAFAQDNSIAEHILKVTCWQLLTEDGFNPSQNFAFEGGITFSRDLKQ